MKKNSYSCNHCQDRKQHFALCIDIVWFKKFGAERFRNSANFLGHIKNQITKLIASCDSYYVYKNYYLRGKRGFHPLASFHRHPIVLFGTFHSNTTKNSQFLYPCQ